MRITLRIVLALFLLSFELLARTPELSSLNIDDGLSQSTVNDVTKGPYGYFWLATQDGLNRFDGYTFKYYNSTNQAVLKSNFFTRVVVFDDHHLLLGTMSGLYKLNVLTEQIEAIHPEQLSALAVSDILVSSTAISVVAGEQLFLYDKDLVQSKQQVNHVLVKTGRALFSYGSELFYLSALGSLEPMLAQSSLHLGFQTFNDLDIEALFVSKRNGKLWVGTQDGVWRLDQDSLFQAIKGFDAKFIAWDNSDLMWLAGQNGIFTARLNDKMQLSGLSKKSNAIFDDPLFYRNLSALTAIGNNIWLGVNNRGVTIYSNRDKWFSNYSMTSKSLALPANDILSVFSEGQDVWVGTSNGLAKITGDRLELFNTDNTPAFFSNRITKVIRGDLGRLWLGFEQGGLVYQEPNGGAFKRFTFYDYSLFVKDFLLLQQQLYIATYTKGLFVIDLNSLQFEHFHKNNLKGLPTNRIQSLQQGLGSEVLLGTLGSGIFQLNPKDKSIKPITEVFANFPTSLNSAIISDMQFIGDKFWVSSSIGLHSYHLLTQSHQHLDTQSGLPNNLVYSLLFDQTSLWLPTNKGVVSYQLDNGLLTTYGKQEGLLNNEYNANAFAIDDNGQLWLGGVDGLSVIDPTHKPQPRADLIPRLTDVKIFNRRLNDEQKQQFWHKSTTETHLVLPPDAQMFSLYFSTFQVELSNAVQFKYKLEGLNEDWVYNVPGVNFFTFTNIDYGRYQLLVSASVDNQNWSVPQIVKIRLTPPPWLTFEAKLFYVMASFALLWLVAHLLWQKIKVEKEAFVKTKISEQKLQLSMHTSGSILWELDLVNKEFRLIDYQSDEKEYITVPYTKQGLVRILHPDDADIMIRQLENTLNNDVLMEGQYLRFRTAEDFIWMKGSFVVIQRSANGVAQVITGVSYNVDKLKQTQLALEKLNKELESRVDDRTKELNHSNQQLQSTLDNLRVAQEELVESQKMAALGAMVAGVSHEINTPLGVCVTSVTHLQTLLAQIDFKFADKSLTPKDMSAFLSNCTEGLKLVDKNVNRAAELVKVFKQVSVDQNLEELSQFTLHSLVNNVLATMEDQLLDNNIVVELDIDQTITLKSYSGALTQVIQSLTSNALEHGFSNSTFGTVKVSCVDLSADDGEVLLIFSDNGSGISEANLAKIFDPFYTSRRGAGSTGLGLHITYNIIVNKLKGAITANSLNGVGTEFYIRLPLNIE